MEIGRKIYYLLINGSVILETGERQGDVVETIETQDFQIYTALQGIQQSQVGVIQCDYGYQLNNFQTYPFHIDITKNPIDQTAIVWDTANPLGASLADVQALKIAQVKDMAGKSLYTTVTSNGVTYSYSIDSGYPAFQKLLLGMVAGIITYPYTLYDVNHVAVSFATVNDLKLLYQDIAVRENAINTKINDYITQVKACQNISDVNGIVVTF